MPPPHRPGIGVHRPGDPLTHPLLREEPREDPSGVNPRLFAAMQAAAARAEQEKREQARRDQESALLLGLDAVFADADYRLSRISEDIDALANQGDRETIDKLEIAMGKVYKLAVFIRGDYDNRDHNDAEDADTQEKEGMLAAAVSAFQEIDNLCDRRLRTYGDKHAEVLQIQNGTIRPSKEQVTRLEDTNRIEESSLAKQAQEAELAVQTMQKSITDNQSAIDELNGKIDKAKRGSRTVRIGLAIVTGGLSEAIKHDIAGFEGQIRQARAARQQAEQALAAANVKLETLRRSRAEVQQRLARVGMTKALLPRLVSVATSTVDRCLALQRSMGPLKEAASQLLVQIREVQQGAVVTTALAYSKKEFVVGILEICNDSLMDSALIDEARMIKEDVLKHYSASIPDEVTEAAVNVDENIALISATPSIRH